MRILAVTVLVAACVEPPGVELDPLDPYGPQVEPWVNQSDGTYTLETTVPVSLGLAYDNDLLGTYSESPGITMLALAEAADFPVLASLEAEVPGITAQLAGWYDVELKNNSLAIFTAWSFSLLPPVGPKEATLLGSLTIAGTQVHYQFDTITFDEVSFELGMHEDDSVSAEPTLTLEPTSNGGKLELGAHEVVISVRAYAEDYNLTRAQTDKRTLLGQATQCPLVAIAVASKCAAGACVAVLPQLTELCERGLDRLFLTPPPVAVTPYLRIQAGSANLIDENHDAVTDRLLGAWNSVPHLGVFWYGDKL